jgi:hypothetical protein
MQGAPCDCDGAVADPHESPEVDYSGARLSGIAYEYIDDPAYDMPRGIMHLPP